MTRTFEDAACEGAGARAATALVAMTLTASRRCIIPAEAFYEPDWRSGRAVPTRIARSDGQPMGIAGIWTGWRAPDGAIVRSMSMLTVNAADHTLMRNFHRPEDEKRMVVILDEADYDSWLDGANHSAANLLTQFDAARLVALPQ